MRVVIFGASGMVGQGILRECLLADDVTEVLSVSRTALDRRLPWMQDASKLREMVRPELFASQDFAGVATQMTGFDACFFPLGISSFRVSEKVYTRVTRDLTLAVANVLAAGNPGMVFCYVSGAGTDAASRTMWARVKGETEQALSAMPFRAVYLFRPGAIIPKDGIVSKTKLYNALYRVLWPVFWLLSRSQKWAATTRTVGRAMLRVVRDLPPERVLENPEINRLGA
jgi:uncharacterized protein YbjT (DUF2867 family)